MSLSSTLWTCTGILHCGVGLAVPELRAPLWRVATELSAEKTTGMADRYEREAAVWFQVAGILMIVQGLAWKQYIEETRQGELPRWWGWTLSIMGAIGVTIMPVSGFWTVLAQGVRIVWRTRDDAGLIDNKQK